MCKYATKLILHAKVHQDGALHCLFELEFPQLGLLCISYFWLSKCDTNLSLYRSSKAYCFLQE